MTAKETATTASRRRYWLSLNEYENPANSVAQTKGEFIHPPELDLAADRLGLDRRSFLKIMGASATMISMAGCTRRPVHTIVPYVNKPLEITHGIPNYYASSDPVTGNGLVLTTRDGRPIKVDGNDEHPLNGHSLQAQGQAAIFDLYDPDRLKNPLVDGNEVSWEEFDKNTADIVARAVSGDSKGLYFLTSTIHSPTLLALMKKFSGKHYVFDSLPLDDIRKGQEESYGKAVLPAFRLQKAKVIVSIDADFLDTMNSPEEFTRGFTETRNLEAGGISKFVAFESSMRLTGQNADLRVPIHPDHRLDIALALAHEVAKRIGKSSDELVAFSADSVEKKTGVAAKIIQDTAEELVRNRGRGLVMAGGVGGKSRNAVAVQCVVNFINSTLGNDGITVESEISPSNVWQGSFAEIQNLLTAMNSGAVNTLIIEGINPVYHLPSSLGFAEALKKVKNVIYFSRYKDETAVAAKFVAAESHPFETWGDVNPTNDLYGIVQPTIRPLYDTRSLLDQLMLWARHASIGLAGKNSYELVRETWKSLQAKYKQAGDFESFWERCLQRGFLDGKGKAAREQNSKPRAYTSGALARAIQSAKEPRPEVAEGAFTLILQPSIALGDGAQANNAHLQELPDPVTKATWGNYLSLSPETAKRLGLKDGEIVRVENASGKVELPVLRQPGLRADVLVSQIGYGRKQQGRVSDHVGVALTDFLQPVNGLLPFLAHNIKISKTGKFDDIAVTQEHHSLEGRHIVFETTYEEYKKNPSAGIVHEMPSLQSIWSDFEYKGYRWGMVIDLNKCTGCSACMVACSVENNVPVVGKAQVIRGRDMHWIRLDRYYSGDAENPETIHQPMTCQQCENAPCETVCPVLATTHSSEGLNQMVYNRCVGTRYCANNCPYKVRRFNYFEYNQPMNGKLEHPLPLSKNPEVTLRSRGVMEKCTFCVQRIEFGKNIAKREGRNVKDGDIKTACQVACPADAIYFGDINDPSAEVTKLSKSPRGFKSLEELNAKPSITYLTKVWNRSPKAGEAKSEGGH